VTDARWIEVMDDTTAAARHFSRAVELHALGGFEGTDITAYRASMALMHSMESGHSSLEGALERILEILAEEKPAAADSYHADLIKRASREIPNRRPAILPSDLGAAADETRRFRHVARRNYDSFRVEEAGTAIAAARLIAARLIGAIEAFRASIDPPI
jgi:hypothetical protein